MRWFRKSNSSPRLLRLSPVGFDMTARLIDPGNSVQNKDRGREDSYHVGKWIRRSSRIDSSASWQSNGNVDDSESENTNYYNVKEMLIVVEKQPQRRWHSETRTPVEGRARERTSRQEAFIREKRNPLLDRVKDTKLSCFRSSDALLQLPDDGDIEAKQTEAFGNRRSERSPVLKTNGISARESRSLSGDRSRRKREWKLEEEGRKAAEDAAKYKERNESSVLNEKSDPGGANRSDSCLSAKIRSISDKLLKSSTNKFIAKLYRSEDPERTSKGKGKGKVRSFSFGALPGLEEFHGRTYAHAGNEDHDALDGETVTPCRSALPDHEDGDSGIIVSDSTSSVSEPSSRRQIFHSRSASGGEVISRSEALEDDGGVHRMYVKRRDAARISKFRNGPTYNVQGEADGDEGSASSSSPDMSSTSACERKFQVVRLVRSFPKEELGIFIAKTHLVDRGAPGYVIAHIVPDGLADRDQNLRIGDEIVNVNGRRLRGLSMSAAKEVLRSGPVEVDIVISRPVPPGELSGKENPSQMRESSVDYENVQIFSSAREGGLNRWDASCQSLPSKNLDVMYPFTDDTLALALDSTPKTTVRSCKSMKNSNSMNAKILHKALDNFNEGARAGVESSPVSSASDKSRSNSSMFPSSNLCTLPRRPKSTACSFHTIIYEKGPGKKSLGFTIVGGKDSPKGALGIFIKSILDNGQAAEEGRLQAGDEILAVNGQVCHDLTHTEAVAIFKRVKVGPVALHICRRPRPVHLYSVSKSCADLLPSSNTDE